MMYWIGTCIDFITHLEGKTLGMQSLEKRCPRLPTAEHNSVLEMPQFHRQPSGPNTRRSFQAWVSFTTFQLETRWREGLSPGWQVLALSILHSRYSFDSFPAQSIFKKLLSRRHFMNFSKLLHSPGTKQKNISFLKWKTAVIDNPPLTSQMI